jgi:DNA ligase-1
VRRQQGGDLWKELRFHLFDAPAEEGHFESRLRVIQLIVDMTQTPYVVAHPHAVCKGEEHLRRELARVEGLGGEGLMLRQAGSTYQAGRSSTLLKVKSFLDAEACVVGYESGRGRHKGRFGALLVQRDNGTRFAVGTGLSDADRSAPPVIGSTIRFRYQELSDAGVPRFPTYIGPAS